MFQLKDGTIRLTVILFGLGYAIHLADKHNVDWSVVGGWVERLAFALVLIVGILLARLIGRDTAGSLTQFNRDDSRVDRYRYETVGKLNSGHSAQMRADATLRVIDAKRVDQLAQSRAALLVDHQRRSAWAVDDDAGNDDGAGSNMGIHYVD